MIKYNFLLKFILLITNDGTNKFLHFEIYTSKKMTNVKGNNNFINLFAVRNNFADRLCTIYRMRFSDA